eukprot:14584594-Ditylum_brightwellii.AAC.1
MNSQTEGRYWSNAAAKSLTILDWSTVPYARQVLILMILIPTPPRIERKRKGMPRKHIWHLCSSQMQTKPDLHPSCATLPTHT